MKARLVFSSQTGNSRNVAEGLRVCCGALLVHAECFYPLPVVRGRLAGRPDARDVGRATESGRALGHNPAVRASMPRPRVDATACSRCGRCAAECPMGNVLADNAGTPRIGRDCIRCYPCIAVCSDGAVRANLRLCERDRVAAAGGPESVRKGLATRRWPLQSHPIP